MLHTNHPIVDRIGSMNIEGMVVPFNWFNYFTFDNGKPDLSAIAILSEILYWYRPTVQKDEATGRLLGATKKFKADLLQRSYDSFAEQFNLTKRQVKEAMDRLEQKGVIWREYRTVKTQLSEIHNVIFIGIHPEKIAESMAIGVQSNAYPPTAESISLCGETDTPLRSNVYPPTAECKTNTEITTENTTKITTKDCNTHARKEKPEKKPKVYISVEDLKNLGCDEQIAIDYLSTRKDKLTQTALNGILKQAQLANLSLSEAIEYTICQSWQSFKAKWYFNRENHNNPNPYPNTGANYETRQRNQPETVSGYNQRLYDELHAKGYDLGQSTTANNPTDSGIIDGDYRDVHQMEDVL